MGSVSCTGCGSEGWSGNYLDEPLKDCMYCRGKARVFCGDCKHYKASCDDDWEH